MLVLNRRIGESIVIGENILVTVVDINSGRVKLGVSAPYEISVHREEVYEAIKHAKGKDNDQNKDEEDNT